MSVFIIIFLVSLFGIIIMISIRAFELKTARIIIPVAFRKQIDKGIHHAINKIISFVHSMILVIFKVVTSVFAKIYIFFKNIVRYLENKVKILYSFIRGNMEISTKKRASEYIEKVLKHKEEIIRNREDV